MYHFVSYAVELSFIINFPMTNTYYGSHKCCLATPCECIGEGNGTPLRYSCLENPMDGGAWWAAVHGVAKSRTRLNDFPFTFHFHLLEKAMATHSSVLAWRIPGTGEPGGLPSMGSHRVGHDCSTLYVYALCECMHGHRATLNWLENFDIWVWTLTRVG